MVNTLMFFILCLVTSSIGHTVNKSPIKSIQTELGSIIDCVDINKQPAFDHPLLKNHTLQTKPSFEVDSPTNSIYALENVSCPEGTVPIPRTTKDDLNRDKSLFNKYNLTQNSIRRFDAKVFLIPKGGPYYGVSGTTSVYHPKVFLGQDSSSHLYVENGANAIVVGWHDPVSHNWWLSVANVVIGYFPGRLFSNLGQATEVGWGGSTVSPSAIGPPMGSGHFPDGNYAHA
ncbi:hypothetical protein A2U01_0001657, partial [Trifolium medium]|nr:hypothetical protein [Trifolium medium]